MLVILASCHSKNNTSETDQATATDSLLHSQLLSRLSDSISRYPDSASLYYERGALLYVTKAYRLAKKDFQKAILINPLESAYYTALGQLFLSQHILDSARQNFYKAVTIDSANKRARLQLAFTLLQQKQYRSAISEADTLLNGDPQLTRALGIQSQAYEAMGDTDKALQIMRKVMDLPPVNYNALMRMGDLLLSKNNQEALSYYKKAAALDSGAAEPYYCMGLLYERQDQYKKATEAFNHCIRNDAFYLEAYLSLGRLYEKTKHWEKARKIFNLAIKISPANSEAYYHRGLANEELNQKEAAVRDYKQALIFNENNAQARRALKKLK